MVPKNKTLRIIYFVNILIIILSFILLYIIDLIERTNYLPYNSITRQIDLIIYIIGFVFILEYLIFNIILIYKNKIIKNHILQKIYNVNIIAMIVSFIILIIMFIINNYQTLNFNDIFFPIMLILVIIGCTLGLLFLILNIIILIKNINIISIILSIIILLWVIYSYRFYFFGVLP
jgi:hypothetical protein